MKIVHLLDYFQPLLGYQETFLAREQLKAGHEVTVVCADRYAPFPNYEETVKSVLGERRQPAGRRLEQGIPVWRLPVRYEGQYRCWLANLKETLQTLQPDVVHAHNVVKFTTFQAAWLKSQIGYRLLVDDHMHWVNIAQSGAGKLFYGAFRRTISRFLARHIDVHAAITAETADISRQIFGFTHKPVHIVELGVDTDHFQLDKQKRQALRTNYKITPDDFWVIYTGKLIPAKAPHWLVEALAQSPDYVKLLLVGNSAADYQQQLDSLINQHQLHDRVHFQAAVPQAQLPQFYSAADAGCWPRQTSIAMLEAAACTLPIVVVSEGVDARVQYDNGLMYEEGDIAQLARHITYLAENRDQASQMGQRGRQLVETLFSWTFINQQFLNLYADRQAH